MGWVLDYEVWVDNPDSNHEHKLLVNFDYELRDDGIGWNEWCGIPSYDSNIVAEVDVVEVAVVSLSGERSRFIEPTDELKQQITKYIEDHYDFDQD